MNKALFAILKRGPAWARAGVTLALCVIGCGSAPLQPSAPERRRATPSLERSAEKSESREPTESAAAVAVDAGSDARSATGATPEEDLSAVLARLRASGNGALADILDERVRQTKRKMKLEPSEAARAAEYLLRDLPQMPGVQRLAAVMPKAAIELVRSVNERGVGRDEAERIADYLLKVRSGLDMENPTRFDENCSHVVGREWDQIDYRDEGMTWQMQKSIYVPKGVLHFKDVANVARFFRVESQAPYFQRLYRVRGTVPDP